MGTHPIFESDFDCLTDMSFKNELKKTLEKQICPQKCELEDCPHCHSGHSHLHESEEEKSIVEDQRPPPPPPKKNMLQGLLEKKDVFPKPDIKLKRFNWDIEPNDKNTKHTIFAKTEPKRPIDEKMIDSELLKTWFYAESHSHQCN